MLREDLAPERAEALLTALDRTPVSIASFGQVHEGRLAAGYSGSSTTHTCSSEMGDLVYRIGSRSAAVRPMVFPSGSGSPRCAT